MQTAVIVFVASIVTSSLLLIVSADRTSASGINTRSILGRQRRQTNCDGFLCPKSKECIDEDKYCDGRVDCKDGGDETERCKNLGCPNFLYRCKYGACISKDKVCDTRIDCKDGSDESSCGNVTALTSGQCGKFEFACKSGGQCIGEDNKCDGTPDCRDKSDETVATCSKITCPGYTFKCKYGACISKRGVCNGLSECLDDSDEDPTLCSGNTPTRVETTSTTTTTTTTARPNRPPIVNTPDSCILPQQLKNGAWQIWGAQYEYTPGDRVTSGTLLQITCRRGYKVDGQTPILLCNGGSWSPNVPSCVQTCDPLIPTETTLITCTYKGVEINCSEAVSHTSAKFSCAPFYQLTTTNDVLYCLDGAWDLMKPSCLPVCGQKNVKIKELIIGGEVVKRGTYPWTIAIYRKRGDEFSHICGGSLINSRVIVTAAHCLTTRNGTKYSEEFYRVAAGKYYRSYNDERDTDAEFSEVEKIFVEERYRGSIYDFEGDIAVIVTKRAFNSSLFIQRICVDWNQNSLYESRLLGSSGIVTGWGYTVRGANASEVLKEISLPYIDFVKCFDNMPDDYKKYVKRDKMCAGYLDQGIGVCEGDSGGGLAFQWLEKNRAYYLRGIVSVAPQISGSCNENEYALYTKISTYIDFIAEIERNHR